MFVLTVFWFDSYKTFIFQQIRLRFSLKITRSINHTHAKKLCNSDTYNLFYGIFDNSGDVQVRKNLRYFHADLRDPKKSDMLLKTL